MRNTWELKPFLQCLKNGSRKIREKEIEKRKSEVRQHNIDLLLYPNGKTDGTHFVILLK